MTQLNLSTEREVSSNAHLFLHFELKERETGNCRALSLANGWRSFGWMDNMRTLPYLDVPGS